MLRRVRAGSTRPPKVDDRAENHIGPSSDPTEHLPHALAAYVPDAAGAGLPRHSRRGVWEHRRALAAIPARGVSLQLKRGSVSISTARRRSLPEGKDRAARVPEDALDPCAGSCGSAVTTTQHGYAHEPASSWRRLAWSAAWTSTRKHKKALRRLPYFVDVGGRNLGMRTGTCAFFGTTAPTLHAHERVLAGRGRDLQIGRRTVPSARWTR